MSISLVGINISPSGYSLIPVGYSLLSSFDSRRSGDQEAGPPLAPESCPFEKLMEDSCSLQ